MLWYVSYLEVIMFRYVEYISASVCRWLAVEQHKYRQIWSTDWFWSFQTARCLYKCI